MTPTHATAVSTAAPPANQQQFTAALGETAFGTNCAVPAVEQLAHPAWTNPDPIHITISSAADATNGTAVCKGPTGGPVTLTANTASGGATPQPLSATVQLTCN